MTATNKEKIGKYEIIEQLGKGAMGVVYKAKDPDIHREVAIKTIRFDLGEGVDEELMGRFVREAQAAGKLDHTNIVTIYDVGREKDLTYIVMQFIKGQSLQQLIAKKKKFSPKEIRDILIPLCEALEYAHQHGIVHRDIKPANILIDMKDKPNVVDFGVARLETSTMTQSGTTVGTPSYMSPEQIMGKRVDNRADIFSLGVILYELATGQRPFSGGNISTLMYKIVNEEPPHITEIDKSLPSMYEDIIEKALAKDPKNRYQSCMQLAAALKGESVEMDATLSYDFDQEETLISEKPKKKTKGLVLGLSVAGVVLIGITALYFLVLRPKNTQLLQSRVKAEQKTQQPLTPEKTPPSSSTLSEKEAADPGVLQEKLDQLKSAFESGKFDDAVKLGEAILAEDAENTVAEDYVSRAKQKRDDAAIAPILQAGKEFYNNRNYRQAITELRKVLNISSNHPEALKYINLANRAIAKAQIGQVIERQRKAEEAKDLLVLLNDIGTQAFSSRRREAATFLFNNFEQIQSAYSKINITIKDARRAEASFSYLLTGVNKTTKKKGVVEEGTKTWLFEKQGNAWKIVGQK
ncbi:MAG: protein kinase [Candidatus Aminicenantes bacterium]|jgi:serine/threonine protein kinase